MSIFLVVRHTRGDEEAGRLELIGSARVGRQAPLASAIAVARARQRGPHRRCCAWCCPRSACPPPGSAALALAIGTCGLAFTGISAAAAQLTIGARAARGLAIGVLGVAFLARAVGDAAGASGPSWLTWVLPLGWTETLRPFAGERWWVLALPLAVFLGRHRGWRSRSPQRRDLGAGLLPNRPGRPAASAALRGPFALAGACSGARSPAGRPGTRSCSRSAARRRKGIGQLVGTSGALTKEFTRIGGQSAIVNAYLSALMLLAGLVAAAYGVSAVLRLHTEETAGPRRPGPRRVGRACPVGAEPPIVVASRARRSCW